MRHSVLPRGWRLAFCKQLRDAFTAAAADDAAAERNVAIDQRVCHRKVDSLFSEPDLMPKLATLLAAISVAENGNVSVYKRDVPDIRHLALRGCNKNRL